MGKKVMPVIVTTFSALTCALESEVRVIYIDACLAENAHDQLDEIIFPYGYMRFSRTEKGGVIYCKPGVTEWEISDPNHIL